MLLIKAIRPEYLNRSIKAYVEATIGDFYSETASQLETAFAELNVFTPLVFVLGPGADPTSKLLKFAQEKGFVEKFFILPLGWGQGRKAEHMIAQARRDG